MTEPLLSGHNLWYSFGETPALRGANLDLLGGEAVAVMGPSGSGKSTLLYCLAGILRPSRGTVRFGVERVDELDERRRSELRRTSFGFIFQFGQLLPELSAIENIALPLLLGGMNRREALAEAQPWFDRLDLAGYEKRRPGQLSGGQAQRIAVGRALVARPAVVFADEPTGALDSLAGEQVMDLFKQAAREEGAALLVVTHEPRVAAYADRTVFVRDGSCSSPESSTDPASVGSVS